VNAYLVGVLFSTVAVTVVVLAATVAFIHDHADDPSEHEADKGIRS
jgi:hypothetical protein